MDDGSGELVQVVCGAPNVKVGLKTYFAQVGGNVNGDYNFWGDTIDKNGEPHKFIANKKGCLKLMSENMLYL